MNARIDHLTRWMLVVAAAALCWPWAARAQNDLIKAPPDPTAIKTRNERLKRISDTLERLIIESDELDELTDLKQPLYFDRPHPEISPWGPDMAPDVLARMTKPISDDWQRAL